MARSVIADFGSGIAPFVQQAKVIASEASRVYKDRDRDRVPAHCGKNLSRRAKAAFILMPERTTRKILHAHGREIIERDGEFWRGHKRDSVMEWVLVDGYFSDQIGWHHQYLNRRFAKALDCLTGSLDYRLILTIKGRIEEHVCAGGIAECLKEVIQQRTVIA